MGLTATVVVLLVKKKSYLRFEDEESKGNANQTSNKGVAIAMVKETEMTDITQGGGAKINENDSSFENPLQAVQVVQTSRPPLIIINKKKASFDSAAAAPPEERTTQSRRIQRKKTFIAYAFDTFNSICCFFLFRRFRYDRDGKRNLNVRK